MRSTGNLTKPRGLASLVGWRRILFTLSVSAVVGLLISVHVGFPVVVEPVFLGILAMLMFLGSPAAALLTRARPAFALVATVPLAAGLIAGESLVSLTLTLLAVLGLLPPS